MKKSIVFLIMISLLFGGYTHTQPTMAADVELLYNDDFEGLGYTVVDGMNGANYTKTLCKDDQPQWTFERKSGGALTDFPAELVSNISAADTGKPVNTTKALNTTGAYKLNNNTVAYKNLLQKYTKGTVTIDLRLKRPAAGDMTTLNLYSEPFTGYSNTSDKVARLDLYANSSSRGRFRYVYEYRTETTRGTDTDVGFNDDNGTKIQGWPYIRMVVDIDAKTVGLFYRLSEVGAMSTWATCNFYANGSGTYHMANGLSAIGFDGDGMLGIDDVKITYENSNTRPRASNVRIIGPTTIGTTLQGLYDYTDDENDPESGSIGTWSSCPDSEFTTYVTPLKTEPVSAALPSEYTISESDLGRYIRYSVVPKNNAVDNQTGIAADAVAATPVRYVNTVPTVQILAPASGEYANFGQPITLTCDAYCDLTDIEKVEYYANGAKIGEASGSPYSFQWTPAATGSYDIVARGYNSLLPPETGDSAPVNIMVSPVSRSQITGDDRDTHIGYTVAGNTTIYGDVALNNTSQSTLNARVSLALYDDNQKLVALGSVLSPVGAGARNQPATASIALTPEIITSATSARLYVWNADTFANYTRSDIHVLIPDSSGMYDMDMYLLLGQSNMSGRAYISSDCKAVIPNVYLFDNNYQWVGAKNPFNKYNNIGEPSYSYNDHMNLGYPFAKMLTEYLPGRKIGIFNNAYGGTNLTQWEKGNAKGFYENTMIKAKEMQKYGRFKGILWHLGSSDMGRGYTRDQYIQKLANFAADLRADLGDDTIPFIIGELAPTSAERIAFNQIFMTINQGAVHVPYSDCVSAEGTTTSDGSHFDATSTKIFGRRYAKVILKMSYGITVPDGVVE